MLRSHREKCHQQQIYIYIYICKYIHRCIHICIYIRCYHNCWWHIYIYIYIYRRIHTYTYTQRHIYIYIYMCVCVCVCVDYWLMCILHHDFISLNVFCDKKEYVLRDVCCLMAERYNTKPNVKLGGFNPSLKRPMCLATLKRYDTTEQSVYG